jgi:hypothetical protein
MFSMKTCIECKANIAKYLTIKDGREAAICLDCIQKDNLNIWDDPNFWATQESFE